eukprot:327270-Rhodomonas_salina.1
MSGVTKRRGSGHGLNSTFEFLEGSRSSFLRFADYTLPHEFTLCSVTRYTSTRREDQGQVL